MTDIQQLGLAAAKSKRIQSMDLLKLFAIFLVIYGHSLQRLISVPAAEQPMFRFIHSFHMPLFMAISGFFAASLQKLSVKEFFVKKGKQLIVPSVVASALVIGINLMTGHETEREYYVFGIWFLKSLFVCSLLYYVATRFTKFKLFALLLSLLFSQIVPYFTIPTMYPAFLFGAVLRQLWPWFKRNSGWLIVLSGVLFVVLASLIDEGDFASVKTSSAIKNFIHGDSAMLTELASIRYYRIAVGLAGTLFFILSFEAIVGLLTSKGVDTGGLSKYGQRTLGVYILQTFVLEVLMAKTLNFDFMDNHVFTFVVAPAISLCVLMFTLWLASLCEKNKVTSLIFLGK